MVKLNKKIRKEKFEMAKISQTKLSNELRAKFTEAAQNFFAGNGEETMLTASNQFCFPVVDGQGNEKWIVVTVTVPKGSHDGDAYDGYGMAEDYKMKEDAKAAKKAEADRKKADAIAKRLAAKAAKAKIKEKA